MYRAYIKGGCIISIAHGVDNGNITEEQYQRIREAVRHKPIAPQGFDYRLKENLVWEQYELPLSTSEP